MIIYLITFIVSCFLIKNANRFKKIEKLIIVIALIIPAILAGIRATTIGTDIKVYLEPLYNIAKVSKNFEIFYNAPMQNVYVKDFEIGCLILIYYITKIFNSIHIVMFIIELIIIAFIYLGLKKIDEIKDYLWLAMFVFYCMFYNITFNIMRQYLGLAIVFWGICSVISNDKGKNIKFWASLVISYFFHKSSIIAIIPYSLYLAMENFNNNNKVIKYGKLKVSLNKLIAITVIVISIFFIFNIQWIGKMLEYLGMSHYNNYITNEIILKDISILRIFPIVIVFILVRKKYLREAKNSWFYLLLFVLNYFFINQLSTANQYASRIGYVFQLFNMIFFVKLYNSVTKENNGKIIKIIIIIYLLFYWWYMFVYKGYHQTIPYIFYWNN